jgi:Rap1a immunity proteins
MIARAALLFALPIILWAGSAGAQGSANEVMPGCRGMIGAASGAGTSDMAACLAVVTTLRNVGTFFAGNVRYCVPLEVTNEQAVRVVVTYVDRIPARMHEPFLKLALEALRTSWPCH